MTMMLVVMIMIMVVVRRTTREYVSHSSRHRSRNVFDLFAM